jgi:hypothetical protein
MALLNARTFTLLMQRLTAMSVLIQAAYGAADDPASGTCAKGAANGLDAVLLATDDPALRAAAYHWRDCMASGGYYYNWILHLLRAIERHVYDWAVYCAAQHVRVHEILRQMYPALPLQTVFCSEPTDIGQVQRTAQGWTCTQTGTIDATRFSDGLLEVVTETTIGNKHIIGQIAGQDGFGQTTLSNAVLIPAHTLAGTVIAIPGKVRQPNAAHFVWIDSNETTLHFQGGSPGDAVRLRTCADWHPALE